SPDGVLSLTPADQAWVSGTQTTLLAGTDLDWLSQGETVIAAAGGIALFTQGSDAPAGKPNQETGIALHAAQGKVSARAHRNEAKVAAKTSVTLASTQADVELAAPSKHLLLTAKGAYLKLEGGNIELGAPGTIEFKATKKEWMSGANGQSVRPTLPGSGEIPYWIGLHYLDPDTEQGIDGAEYEITFDDGQRLSGKLDATGKAQHDGIENKPVKSVVYKPRPGEKEQVAPPLEDLLSM